MSDEYQFLIIEKKDETVWVTINRPLDRNSMHSPLMAELTDLIGALNQSAYRAMVFTGAGDDYFVGGADGIEMMRLDPAGARDFSVRIQDLYNRIQAGPLLTVAAINGLCFGGGYELALACDFRVAVETARLGLPEVKVGLIPGAGGTQRLTRLVGPGRALEMILSGRLYPADQALDMGLIHRVAAKGNLARDVDALLATMLRHPQYALSLAKEAVYAFQGGPLDWGLRAESDAFGRCFEHRFFPDLMRRQLQDGLLDTTSDVSDIVKETSR